MKLLQYILPQKILAYLANLVSNCSKFYIKNTLIKLFIKNYKINLNEAIIKKPELFQTFNDFFTRKLDPSARVLNLNKKNILSPIDGFIQQVGNLSNSNINAKNYSYDLNTLLGIKLIKKLNLESKSQYKTILDLADYFKDGQFINLYLSPKDYHRVHMPISGELQNMIYIPGKLYSVNPQCWGNKINHIFQNNERVVNIFKTELGYVAIILVGAMIVGGIETSWHGTITPPHKSKNKFFSLSYQNNPIHLNQGDELGLFNLGSTVVMLFSKDAVEFEDLINDSEIKLYNKIASVN
tara:strand:+ start:9513 stop:10400 length:888 start_codon:yes stop_codon:yes gene_type:complete